MPYKSEAQRKFFHTATARKKGISKDTVEEFDKASKGKNLPERSKKPKKAAKAIMQAIHSNMGKKRV